MSINHRIFAEIIIDLNQHGNPGNKTAIRNYRQFTGIEQVDRYCQAGGAD